MNVKEKKNPPCRSRVRLPLYHETERESNQARVNGRPTAARLLPVCLSVCAWTRETSRALGRERRGGVLAFHYRVRFTERGRAMPCSCPASRTRSREVSRQSAPLVSSIVSSASSSERLKVKTLPLERRKSSSLVTKSRTTSRFCASRRQGQFWVAAGKRLNEICSGAMQAMSSVVIKHTFAVDVFAGGQAFADSHSRQ